MGPRGSAAHCVGTAFHRGDEDYAPPGSTSYRQANDPQVPGTPFAALFAQTHEETGPCESAAHFLESEDFASDDQEEEVSSNEEAKYGQPAQ